MSATAGTVWMIAAIVWFLAWCFATGNSRRSDRRAARAISDLADREDDMVDQLRITAAQARRLAAVEAHLIQARAALEGTDA